MTANGCRVPEDFDGTIFMQDTGHVLFDKHGCGEQRRKMLDEQIRTGERSFRDVSEEMWGSLDVPFEDGFEVMKEELELDVQFRDFHSYCVKNDIPFHVISAGLKPVLRKVLDTFLGEEAVCARTTPTPMAFPDKQMPNTWVNSLPESTSSPMMQKSRKTARNGSQYGAMTRNSATTRRPPWSKPASKPS